MALHFNKNFGLGKSFRNKSLDSEKQVCIEAVSVQFW